MAKLVSLRCSQVAVAPCWLGLWASEDVVEQMYSWLTYMVSDETSVAVSQW